jgi:hypothetical protein
MVLSTSYFDEDEFKIKPIKSLIKAYYFNIDKDQSIA